MRRFIRLAAVAGVVLGLSALVAPAAAGAEGIHQSGPFSGSGASHAVFVQTDNTVGNQVVAYERADNGLLTQSAIYNTGGLGGVLNGSAVDHLASQGSLAYDQRDSSLYAVNAGSNTVSVFSVHGDQLALRQVVSSGGVFPVSVAVRGRLVYVLNAENGGSVKGFVADFGYLFPLPGSNRNLGLTIPTGPTQFTSTPGQVAFSPDGSQLIVTTKGSTNAIDVFHVGFFGELSPAPVVNIETGALPFAVTFDAAGNLVVADTGIGSLVTYSLSANGTLTQLDAVSSTQAATCWVAPADGFFFTSNAGSASVSSFQEGPGGQLSLLGQTTTDPGTVDASPSAGGQFLYVQTGGNGIVDEFAVNANGSLTEIGSMTVPDAAGGEGIAAF
jgi:6-phosphogluconolactonase (cycloisomerase 2 family)